MYRLLFALWLLIFTQTNLTAQGHLPVFPEDEGRVLLTKLEEEFRPRRVLSYKDAREYMYRELYNVNDSVTCVYSGHKVFLDQKTGDAVAYLYRNGDKDGINCEHTFPQSYGAKDGFARSDMHHLYPTRIEVNTARSNSIYAEIDDADTEVWYYQNRAETDIPSIGIDLYSEKTKSAFEPREDHKGNVARAMFYFATIYRDQADTAWFADQITDLCRWHELDPVDRDEWERNERIAEIQDGKLNPFILDCTLAYRSYCADMPPCTPETYVKSNTPANSCQLISQDNQGTHWILTCENQQLTPVGELVNTNGQVLYRSEGAQTSTDTYEWRKDQATAAGWYVFRVVDKETSQLIGAQVIVVLPGH
jgi:endonuclease I